MLSIILTLYILILYYLQSRKFPVAWNLNNNNNNNFLVKLEIFIESFRSYWRVVQVFEIIQHHRHAKISQICVCIYIYICVWAFKNPYQVLSKKIIYSTNEAWITTNFNVSNLVPLHVNAPNCNINVDFISHYPNLAYRENISKLKVKLIWKVLTNYLSYGTRLCFCVCWLIV